MIVVADCDILSHWSNNGIVTYLMNLLGQLSRSDSDREIYAVVRKPPAGLSALASSDSRLKLISPRGPGWLWRGLGGVLAVSPLGSGWFWKQLSRAVFTQGPHNLLLFVPAHRVPLIPFVPKVVVIHDLGFELFPESFRFIQRKRMSWATRLAVHRSDLVISTSDSTKQDLINCYGCTPDRICVVHHGYDSRRFEPSPVPAETRKAILNKYGLSKPFFLHVGVLQPRKNLVRLVDAFTRVMNEDHSVDAQLAIVGQPGWKYDPILRRATAPDTNGRVVVTGPVQPEELPVLYKSSLALVMPSLYEGFGLPVLEAMACGVAVACSRTSSLTEIAAQSALLFDPYSVDEIAAALLKLWRNPSLRATLVDRGFQRAAMFSWQKTARETLEAFAELLALRGSPQVSRKLIGEA